MALFDIPKSRNQNSTKDIVGRVIKGIVTPPPILMKSNSNGKKGDILSRINSINTMVQRTLGQYSDRYIIIRDLETLKTYIQACIDTKEVAIDTETSGLDPMLSAMAGISLYTPGQKAAYIPVNHISYITGLPVVELIPVKQLKDCLQELVDKNVKIIMFNAKFDIRVIWNQVGVKFKAYWDGYIASRLLNENEPSHGLKRLHQKYCMNNEAEAFSFDELFDGFNFQYIPIKTGYIYAARDAEITYELYKYQLPFLTKGTEENELYELERVAEVFWEIEMPLIETTAELENTGIRFDFEITEELSKKYNQMLIEREQKFHDICSNYQKEIDSYRRIQGMNCKLDTPISIGSPTQIAILIYDILKLPSVNKDKKRGTGEEILVKLDHELCKAVLSYREAAKIITTYVDKMPNVVNPNDGRIHASFNQYGADTGRFSSSAPNCQNIPARGMGKEVRKMFAATPGYLMISSDYSAQEPRLTAHMSKDHKMIQAYKEGKDLYCEVASIAFEVNYEDCFETFTDGKPNPEGKKRRSTAKAIVLGVCYGKGIAAIAEDLHISKKKAAEIYETIMREFPGLKSFIEESQQMAVDKGYVDTVWGRKRRLPNMQLPKYEFKLTKGANVNFDPLSDEEDEPVLDEGLCRHYENQLNRVWGFQKKLEIIMEARKDGLEIKDNSGKISESERQAVNSRIQGSAADMSKRAMNLIYRDPQMREYGFRMLIPVHDEIIGEAPIEHAKEAAQRLSELMIQAGEGLDVPIQVDTVLMQAWFDKEYSLDNVDELLTEINEDEEKE